MAPNNPNFYFIKRPDLDNSVSFKLNILQPTQRTKIKAFFSTLNHDSVDIGQVERFKAKFLGAQARSSQINGCDRGREEGTEGGWRMEKRVVRKERGRSKEEGEKKGREKGRRDTFKMVDIRNSIVNEDIQGIEKST